MTRISKRKIPDKYLIKIYQLFFEVIARPSSKDNFLLLLDDIFSPTEKIMLAKRIGIIYLIIKKVDQRTIADILKVSTSTVSKFALIFNEKQSQLISLINTMLNKEKILNFMDDLLSDFFIQPGFKIGHYQSYLDHKRRQEERKILP